MKVILLEKIHNLGALGDTVNIAAGYGRNYLIPQGKAVPANADNIAKFEARRAELEKVAAEKLAVAQKRAEKMNDLALTLVRKVIDETRLFGSIGVHEIAEELASKNIEVEKREISLPQGPIREIGEYEIELMLHSDVTVPVKVIIEAEQ